MSTSSQPPKSETTTTGKTSSTASESVPSPDLPADPFEGLSVQERIDLYISQIDSMPKEQLEKLGDWLAAYMRDAMKLNVRMEGEEHRAQMREMVQAQRNRAVAGQTRQAITDEVFGPVEVNLGEKIAPQIREQMSTAFAEDDEAALTEIHTPLSPLDQGMEDARDSHQARVETGDSEG